MQVSLSPSSVTWADSRKQEEAGPQWGLPSTPSGAQLWDESGPASFFPNFSCCSGFFFLLSSENHLCVGRGWRWKFKSLLFTRSRDDYPGKWCSDQS